MSTDKLSHVKYHRLRDLLQLRGEVRRLNGHYNRLINERVLRIFFWNPDYRVPLVLTRDALFLRRPKSRLRFWVRVIGERIDYPHSWATAITAVQLDDEWNETWKNLL